MRRAAARISWPVAFLGMAAAYLGACETKVLRYNPPLAGLPGAQTGMAPVYDSSMKVSNSPLATQATAKPVIENPDGTKTLISRNGRDLMFHIATCMREDDEKTFTEQVLSEMTRDEFYERGYDPKYAFREMKRRREDLEKMFKMLPAAELSPGVRMEMVGENVMRVRLHYVDKDTMPWCGFDMKLEGTNWKLRWFIENDGK
ncbi:MAG: hypothetical protein JNK16_16610 [Phycisphaerales bacterium]|nr:hypothetical protein [Phycisphaerales bacterium]